MSTLYLDVNGGSFWITDDKYVNRPVLKPGCNINYNENLSQKKKKFSALMTNWF